jgi:transposase
MFIGIDIGAAQLDVAASSPASTLPRRVANTPAGIATLTTALGAVAPELIVCEATGNYHQPLLAALLAADLPVAVVNPAAVAAFRQSRLGRHKTDRSDAALLARFAELHHAELRRAEPTEPARAELRALVGYRDDLIVRRTRLRNQRHAADWAGSVPVVAWLEDDLAELEGRVAEVEQAIRNLLATLPETAILTAQTGVGLLVAAAVLAYLPAGVLGHAKAAAAYAGLHPRQEQSGQRARSRLSKQGCPALRRYLHLAALSAIRFDPELRVWYQRLCARGKAPQSARCAVAHKLLRRLMGRLRAWRQASHDTVLPRAA